MSADSRGEAAGTRGAPPAARRPLPENVRQPLLVRSATFADLPTVVELRLALLKENGTHPVYGRLRPDARERAYSIFGAQLRAAGETMLLAERDATVVGILRCVDTPNSPLLLPERYCYVSSVYVRPAVRRTGVLKVLLAAAEDWCRKRGLSEMRLHNVGGGVASAAWTALGFDEVEQVRLRIIGGDPRPASAGGGYRVTGDG